MPFLRFPENHFLMVVEDSDSDFFTLERVFKKNKINLSLLRMIDGDSALQYLYDSVTEPQHLPSLILLDLNLPGTNGHEILQELKQNMQLQRIPIVILTTSHNPQDINFCYDHGANSYIIKSIDLREFQQSLLDFVNYWYHTATLPSFL